MLLGSIQKIQAAPLEDFLCCADFKAPQPLRRQLPAGGADLNVTLTLPAARQPQADSGKMLFTAQASFRENGFQESPQTFLKPEI